MRTGSENKILSELLFSDIKLTPKDIFKEYPKRNLSKEQLVLRFAPSPTGFLHIGNVYTSLAGYILTKRSKGIFILRVEDTDKVREVKDGITQIVKGLEYFGIDFDEGMINEHESKGEYGPYMQSKRVDIYKVFAKELVSKGLAYPCFCTDQELEDIRQEQVNTGCKTGYWGKWSKWREASFEEVKKQLDMGTPFVIRLYSTGDGKKKIDTKDLIKGTVTLCENDMDAVLLKSDGLPTYHFAHPIDDTLMGVSFVLRGDEWLSSESLHLDIFNALGFTQLEYAHISPLMKLENGGKRKLSKRKDPEASISYYIEHGYPVLAVKEYLLNIANSNFSDWRVNNKGKDILEFELRLEKFNRAGALFDLRKLNDISKEYISTLGVDDIYKYVLEWAKEFNTDIYTKLTTHKEYCVNILNIEREGENIRKDVSKWSDIPLQFEIFFDDMFNSSKKEVLDIEMELQRDILKDFLDTYYFGDDANEWFNKIKQVAVRYGFCLDYKEYECAPHKYKGKVGDVAMILRVAITGRKQTPDLYQIMQVMGEDRVRSRIKEYID